MKEKLVVGYSLRFNSEVYSLWLVELSYPVCMCFIIRGSRKQCQETHFISVLIIISAVEATQNKCLAFPEIAIDSAADFTRPINNSFLHTPLPQCIFVITISVPPVLSSACNWSRINGWFHLFPGKKKEIINSAIKNISLPYPQQSCVHICICVWERQRESLPG